LNQKKKHIRILIRIISNRNDVYREKVFKNLINKNHIKWKTKTFCCKLAFSIIITFDTHIYIYIVEDRQRKRSSTHWSSFSHSVRLWQFEILWKCKLKQFVCQSLLHKYLIVIKTVQLRSFSIRNMMIFNLS